MSAVLSGRFKLQRRIKTLASDGVFSAWIMLLLPLALFAVMNIFGAGYFKPVYDSPDRLNILYIFLGLELSAAIWIRLIINIDA